ncbi:MAG: Serine dehydrogenase proteinase [Candidatus Scalindua rubra]|uniref:Serine dehydrogenase proteinase n=1 Tax=Candidatus Scalindua rubra TaxID=1872076 RepID=A0A1E3X5Q7_9BACT|nr:MAG: Serine dehydrogenase proteinase [Candidatus Scalindua rubra]
MPKPLTSISANITVENLLNDHIQNLENELKADFLIYFGPIIPGVESEIRDAVELRKKKTKKLIVILETEGGYAEIVERIANVFRKHYKVVEFIVPNFAMSAGTILVMCGDAIYMDYFSILGPIDPQVQTQRGGMPIPALGYLDKYKDLIDKSSKGELTEAELHFLIEKFDPAVLHKFEQEKELSITLLKTWLAKYKFKNWKTTKKRKIPVTKNM